jgi:hypothetical protein
MAPLQLAKRSGVEIVRSGWSNGHFLDRHIKGDASETAPSLPPLKLAREGSFHPSTAHRRCHLPSKDLAHPNPLSLQSSRCNSPPPRAMAPRRATGAARSSEAAPQPAVPLLDSRIKSSREL